MMYYIELETFYRIAFSFIPLGLKTNTRKPIFLLFPGSTNSGQIAKTRQKLHSKNSWNWVVILVSATIWQVLNGKCIKTGNENDVNQLKIALKNSWNHIKVIYFWRILPIWNHSEAVRRWNDWSNSAQARSLCQKLLLINSMQMAWQWQKPFAWHWLYDFWRPKVTKSQWSLIFLSLKVR